MTRLKSKANAPLNRNRVLLVSLLAALIGSVLIISPTRKAAATGGTFDAVGDFSTSNPNGAWSYGREASLGSAFTPFAVLDSAFTPGVYYWYGTNSCGVPGQLFPLVAFNRNGSLHNYNGGVSQPANMLSLHPSCDGELSVVRWTAPSAGTFNVQGLFQGIDTRSTTTDVHVLRNSSIALHTANINGFGDQSPFSFTATVAAGDTLDFLVGFGNGSFGADSTGLAVTITDTSATCTPPPANMVSWWPGDGYANDIQGGNNGTLTNGAAFAPGKVGQAFSFDGNDDFVDVPYNSNLDLTQALTVDAWVNPSILNQDRGIVEKTVGGGVNTQYLLYFQGGSVVFRLIKVPGVDHATIVSDSLIPVNTWTHVAGTWDGVTMKLFVNGVQQARTFDLAPPINGGVGPTLIGKQGSNINHFAGLIDEVEIFDRALSSQELLAIYQTGSLGKCKAGPTPTPIPTPTPSPTPTPCSPVVNIADGDVAGLIAAMNSASATGCPSTINLAHNGNYTLTAVADSGIGESGAPGPAGLPYIRSQLTINGNGATIQRSSAPGTPDFVIIAVSSSDSGNHHAFNAKFTLNGVTLRGASRGALGITHGSASISNSTITQNTGGGINNFCGKLTLLNSTVSYNTSGGGAGGGVFLTSPCLSADGVDPAVAYISFSTIFENQNASGINAQGQPYGPGYAIADEFGSPGDVVIKNSILASPTRGFFPTSACFGPPPVSLGHNIVGDGSCGLSGPGDMNNTNPVLGPLANNGGPTPTHAPLACSPAIDAVPVADSTDANGVPITTDQRGFLRPQSTASDIGAVEAVNLTHAVKLFAVSAQGENSTNQLFRYDVAPTGPPSLDMTMVDSSFDRPASIAFSKEGEMFVTNRGPVSGSGGSVSRFLNAGVSPLFNGSILSSSFNLPHGAAFKNGELFVAQRFGAGALRFLFDATGNGSPNGSITNGLNSGYPRGVTVNPTTGELFVTECCGINEINRYVFDSSGNAIPNGVITGGGLSNPHDLAFSPWGELFVANSDSGNVLRFVFDSSGNATPNGQLSGNGQCAPIGLAFSPWGELFVSSHFCPTISRWVFNGSFQATANGSFSTPATLGWLAFVPLSGLTVIPSTSGPWSPSLNPTFDYGIHDEGPPVVIDATSGLSFTPGSTLTVSYVSGLVQAGVGYPRVDANGEPGNVVNFAEGRPARFPAFYMNPGPDVMSMELVGTFANNGVIVGQPFPIGNGPTTLTVPTGANQLLLGIDDALYRDNSGALTVQVTGTPSNTSLSVSCPAPITVSADTNCQARVPDVLAGVTSSGASCSGSVTLSQSPAAGTIVGLGTTTITVTATDASQHSVSCSTTFTVTDNTPPTVSCPSPMTASADSSCQAHVPDVVAGVSASDSCGGPVTLSQSPAAGMLVGLGTTTITVTATDASHNSSSCSTTFTVSDTTPPTITAPADINVVDNAAGSCGASVNPGTPVTADSCGIASVVGTRSDGRALTDQYPVGCTLITWTVTDHAVNTATAQQSVTVTNPAPQVTITGPSSGALYVVNTTINFSGSFTDNSGDSHAAVWTFDGVPQAGSVNETDHTVSATHSFGSAGVYLVTLRITDDCGQTVATNQVGGFDALVVVYDPNAGFVTGGGWINSPPGAYAANPTLLGKANFGFVSKYQTGANIPDGQTEFQFKVANLNFHSTVYDWLVVSGPKAQYKGTGTINGTGNYGFMLTATDGDLNGGGGVDKFRIKIWDKNNGDAIVYDNQMGAGINDNPTTALGGGSIVIHK
jgi:hypothetical protein